MLSIAFGGGVAYDTVDDEPVVTVALPGPPPTANTDVVYIAFWAGRVNSAHTATGMQAMGAVSNFGNVITAGMWTYATLESYLLYGLPPLVLTRTFVERESVTDTLASGVSVRILAYRVTKTEPPGHTLGLTYGANVYRGIGYSGVDGTTLISGLVTPQFFAAGYPFTEAQLWPSDPPSSTVAHYGMALFAMITPPFWRADFTDPDDIWPYFDGVPSVGCTYDDPLPNLGQPALTRRYDPEQPYTRNAVWDSLSGGIQQASYPLENTIAIHTPTPLNQAVSFGSIHVPGVDVHVFGMQYEAWVWAGHLRIREELLPYPDQPPPVVVPEFCPPNIAAVAAPGPLRLRTEDPVLVRLDPPGRQPASVTAVVP